MAQLFADRVRLGEAPAWRLLVAEIRDAAAAAPRLQWEESLMNRIVLISTAGTAALLAAFAFGPLAAVPVVAVALVVAIVSVRRMRPISTGDSRRRRFILLLVGLALLAVAVALGATADDDLSEVAWAIFALSVVTGLALTLAGVVAVVAHRRSPSAV